MTKIYTIPVKERVFFEVKTEVWNFEHPMYFSVQLRIERRGSPTMHDLFRNIEGPLKFMRSEFSRAIADDLFFANEEDRFNQ